LALAFGNDDVVSNDRMLLALVGIELAAKTKKVIF
jgi:hypothetical protein